MLTKNGERLLVANINLEELEAVASLKLRQVSLLETIVIGVVRVVDADDGMTVI